jgi:Type I phosphodiesterase / nucleotide pyrophosphatase
VAESTRGRVVILVLDALGPEFVSSERTPNLVRLARAGGIAPAGGLADLVASTGPGHAALLTGEPSTVHGVLANRIVDEQGQPVTDVRVRVPTILRRARDAGCSTAIVAGDPDILNTVQGDEAHLAWPGPADLAARADSTSPYLPDIATLEAAFAAVRDGYDLVVVQFQDVDTIAHASGIESELSREAQTAADAAAGELAAALGRDWPRTLLVVVSDHRAESVVTTEPVRLAAALAGLADVAEDGSAALVRPTGDIVDVLARARTCPGVGAITPLDERHLVAWGEPGRVFGHDRPVFTRAAHGNGTTRPCVAIVSGGHPVVASLAAQIRICPPPLTLWAHVAAEVLSIPGPAARPTAGWPWPR